MKKNIPLHLKLKSKVHQKMVESPLKISKPSLGMITKSAL